MTHKLFTKYPSLLPFRRLAIDIRDLFIGYGLHKNIGVNKYISKHIKGKVGLEIGGPSWLWRSYVPIYRWAKRVDNLNRASTTIFGQNHKEGRGTFNYWVMKSGDQYISEGNYSFFKDDIYDFVVLRDVLEHLANPIKMLIEIRRIIKPGGVVILTVPNKLGTFDYGRPNTTFAHIFNDYINQTQEDDETHFQEAIDLIHDHITPEYTSRDELTMLIKNNVNTRFLHHHVFSEETLSRVCSEAGFRTILLTKEVFPEIIIMIEKYPDRNLTLKPSMDIIKSYQSVEK
jgi:SAM-dependent methyltransferase